MLLLLFLMLQLLFLMLQLLVLAYFSQHSILVFAELGSYSVQLGFELFELAVFGTIVVFLGS